MVNCKEELGRLRRQLLGRLAAYEFLRAEALLLVIFATVALAVRVWGGRLPIVFLVPLLMCGLLYALIKGRRALPNEKNMAALLDSCSGMGGLLSAEHDGIDTSGWNLAEEAVVPEICWDSRRQWLTQAMCWLFLVLVYLLPARAAQSDPNALELEPIVDKLEDQIETLLEEEVIEEEQAETWRERLERMNEDGLGDDPERAWENLDQLAQRLEETALEEAAESMQWLRQMAAMDALTEELANTGTSGEAQEAQAAQIMEQLASRDERSAELLSKMASGGAKGLTLDKETLEKLKKLLGEMSEEELQRLQQLAKERLLSEEQMKACQNAAAQGFGELDKWLEEHPGAGGAIAGMGESGSCSGGQCNGSCPGGSCDGYGNGVGRGGVGRGPGHARLNMCNETDETGAAYNPNVLAGESDTSESIGVGESFIVPEVDETAEASTGGALESDLRAGGADTRLLLPQHRGAVKRYFERTARPED